MLKAIVTMALLLGMMALGLAQSARGAKETIYFPEEVLREEPILRNWYSIVLTKLEEPPLVSQNGNASSESYRFLWLRTFNYPISVRINVKADGTAVVTTKLADGSAGFPYTIKRTIENSSRSLTREQMNDLRSELEGVGFWSLPSVARDQTGTDGADWVFEAVKESKYKFVTRWSPCLAKSEKHGICRLGLTFARKVGGLKIPDKDVY
jgi:hypothetical protein